MPPAAGLPTRRTFDRSRPPSKIGCVNGALKSQAAPGPVNRLARCVLWMPAEPVSGRLGNNCARATPMLAVAAASCCSAARMSGRRSSRRDGSPAGTSGGAGWSISARPRGIACGLSPVSVLSRSSCTPIWRSVSGMVSAAVSTSCSAWRTSSRAAAPPLASVLVSASDSRREARVFRAISSSRSSSRISK